MSELKAIQFLASNEHFNIIEQIGNFLQMTWEDEKMSKIFSLTEDIIRYNQTAEPQVKELIKKWLDFLNEEEVNNLYQFLEENLLPKVRELWQQDDIDDDIDDDDDEKEEMSEEEQEESFDEKEKRYIQLMETIIEHPELLKNQKTKQKILNISTENINSESIKKEEPQKQEVKNEEYKTITFQPEKEHKEAVILKNQTTNISENLPDETIVIIKKKDEDKNQDDEDKLLDLSKL
jgi:hypothetical protein